MSTQQSPFPWNLALVESSTSIRVTEQRDRESPDDAPFWWIVRGSQPSSQLATRTRGRLRPPLAVQASRTARGRRSLPVDRMVPWQRSDCNNVLSGAVARPRATVVASEQTGTRSNRTLGTPTISESRLGTMNRHELEMPGLSGRGLTHVESCRTNPAFRWQVHRGSSLLAETPALPDFSMPRTCSASFRSSSKVSFGFHQIG